ncbi:LysR family transcriptional regulator substrate-binding protein [Kitasatospora sp. NPDC093558]|uniref:LysR family transcriptional regulator substrate-binding protein n=1 Tax=Kitasatospora sp. NPDC093558 TaxID=3155201 RepID=UPI0034473441
MCGQGIGIAPETMSRPAPREDVAYRPVADLGPSQVGLYWPKERRLTPAMAAFVHSCRATFASGSADQAAGTRPQPRRARGSGTDRAVHRRTRATRASGSTPPAPRTGR